MMDAIDVTLVVVVAVTDQSRGLRVVTALRVRPGLQHIGQVIKRLKSSYDRPLTELRIGTARSHLYLSVS